MKQRTLLFLGAGISQARAIVETRKRGFFVVAVDGDPDASGLAEADVGAVCDPFALDEVVGLGRKHDVAGVLTVSSDRLVPAVAAAAEALRLPGIGMDVAHRVTHKGAMRIRLARRGVPQPPFAIVRTQASANAALDSFGYPAVLKPIDSGGQRGLACVHGTEEIAEAFAAASAASRTGEVIVERFCEGLELNGIVIVRGGKAEVLTLSERLRPPGRGFGVGWAHVFPARLSRSARAEAEWVASASVLALGVRDGIGFPQLLVADDGSVRVVEVAARIPAGQMIDLVLNAVGVDLVEIAVLQALGEPVPDEVARARFERPTAIRFLTGPPGRLPVGRVRRIGSLAAVLAAAGVVAGGSYLKAGELIQSVALDVDRRAYVVTQGDTPDRADELATKALELFDVEIV